MRSQALVALTRFGLGVRPGELSRVGSDPRGYVVAQCDTPGAALINGLRTTEDIRQDFLDLQSDLTMARKEARSSGSEEDDAARDAAQKRRNETVKEYQNEEIAARFDHGVDTDRPFLERLVLFWSNHFAINRTRGLQMRMLAGDFEREAIRPHVLGSFQDMLAAATLHPAMLIYLDNNRSIGPTSVLGTRKGVTSANENLARELLELHTLGAGGGYTQADVIAVASTLTGWNGGFLIRQRNSIFEDRWHDYGPRTILGREYAEEGQDQIETVLPDLAAHPSTARHIARKFARHFVGDEAPDALIDALATSFHETEGDLYALTTTLLEHDAAWAGEPVKTVPPYDFMLATCRALDVRNLRPNFVARAARDLAHDIWAPPSPAGWPDDDGAFLGGDSLLERVDFASQLVSRSVPPQDVRQFARDLFGAELDPVVADSVARAEDRRQALVLLLMSPAFQRR